jgi:hypothetical protein
LEPENCASTVPPAERRVFCAVFFGTELVILFHFSNGSSYGHALAGVYLLSPWEWIVATGGRPTLALPIAVDECKRS